MTHVEIDPLAADPLAQRLGNLPLAIPPTLVARALERTLAPRRRVPIGRRLTAGGGIGAAVLIGVNGLASFWMPVWGQALASAPVVSGVTGPLLRSSGLASRDITVMDDTASSSGVTLHLIGGDADGLSTVLFIDETGADSARGSRTLGAGYLLDQFGHRYDQLPSGSGWKGVTPVGFAPLSGAAGSVGARFTVHFDVFADPGLTGGVLQWAGEPAPSKAKGGPGAPETLVWVDPPSLPVPAATKSPQKLGSIELHGRLLPSSAREITPPPAITRDRTTYQITAIRASSSRIQLATRVSGRLFDRQQATAAKGSAADLQALGALDVSGRLLDPSGHSVEPVSGFGQSAAGARSIDVTTIYPWSGSGTYRWEVRNNSGTVIGERDIVITG